MRQHESRSSRRGSGATSKGASVVSDRSTQARPVALMLVWRGSYSPPELVSRIPGVQSVRETLKSRRVCETRISLAGRLAPRLHACLIKPPFRVTVE